MSDIAANVPDLKRQFELLWRHYSFKSMFGGLLPLDGLARDYRHILVYLATKTARHYRKAREITLNSHGLLPDTPGEQANLLILEFPFEFEDCINSMSRSVDMVIGLVEQRVLPQSAREKFDKGTTYGKFRKIRNFIEHPLARLSDNRKPGQPLRLLPADDCSYIALANHKVTFADTAEVLHEIFDLITTIVPSFRGEAGQPDVPQGPLHLSISTKIEVTQR